MIISKDFELKARDGVLLFARELPAEGETRAVVQVLHGMAEHSERYLRLARALCGRGYTVYASDHRGHGRTVESPIDLGFLGEDGFSRLIEDQCDLLDHAKRHHPGVPVFMLGHSMGSYIAREVTALRGGELAGLVLSGSGQSPPARFKALSLAAKAERLRLGPRGKSPLLRSFSTDAFNKPFEPARTPHDWLSREEAEVDAFAADPLCGFVPSTQFWCDFMATLAHVCSDATFARFPRGLPVLVLAGEKDSTLEGGKGLRALQDALARAQVADVTTRVYADARHEVFNELNRDEVTEDLLGWLDDHASP